MNESHLPLFVIAAFLLEKEDIKGGEHAQCSVEDKQSRKYCLEKTDFWKK